MTDTPKDTALIVGGVVAQVWRNSTIEAVTPTLPEGEHDLIEFDDAAVRCGMLWDGEELSDPPGPPPPRRTIPKSTITARLRAMGKFAAAWAGLMADPDKYDQWYTPDWPNVFADDAGLLAFLEVLALTPEQIAAVTAP